MMEVIEAIFVIVGLLALLAAGALLVSAWLVGQRDQIDEDLGPHHRDGLDAAARISAMALEAAHAMHEAARDAGSDEER